MQAYIQYLEQVLGLKNIIWPEMQSIPVPAVEPAAHPALLVLFVAEKRWSAKAEILFQRMREAMTLSESQVKVLFASEASLPDLQFSALSAERVVCFSHRLFEQISSDAKVMTFDPEELLQKPELKKQTWDSLKKVMASLGLL